MSQITGPFTLTAAETLTETDPAIGNASVAVQLQNASQFTLDVQASGILSVLQPFSAVTVPLTNNQPVVIQVTGAAAAGSTNTLTLEWLLNGEQPASPDGPLTAAAIAALLSGGFVETQGIELVYSESITNNAPFDFSFTALHNYAALLVVYFCTNSIFPLWVEAQDQTVASSNGEYLFAAMFKARPDSNDQVQAIIACPIQAGDSAFGALFRPDTDLFTGTLTIYGLLSSPTIDVRGDGRNAPIGGEVISGDVTNGSTNIIAAPSAGRIMLYSIQATASPAVSGSFQIEGTVNGTLRVLGTGYVVENVFATNIEMTWPNGLLLDAATALTLVATTVTAWCTAAFDYIS